MGCTTSVRGGEMMRYHSFFSLTPQQLTWLGPLPPSAAQHATEQANCSIQDKGYQCHQNRTPKASA
jgi:hypothetical protein